MIWQKLSETPCPFREVTYRARVPGGYLYRHRSTLLITRDQVDKTKNHPHSVSEMMVFVPHEKRKRRR